MCAKFSFLFVYFYAHFKRVRNFLMEPDTDMFIENKNVPDGRFSRNILKKLYRMRVRMRVRNFLTEPDTNMFIENKNVPDGQFSPNIVKKLCHMHVSMPMRNFLTELDAEMFIANKNFLFGHSYNIHLKFHI